MSLQSQEWLLTVQQMCGMFYGRRECYVVVRLWGSAGGVGDHSRRVLSGDFFMYCRGMDQTTTTRGMSFWSSHQGKTRKECLKRSVDSKVQSLCTQKCHNTSWMCSAGYATLSMHFVQVRQLTICACVCSVWDCWLLQIVDSNCWLSPDPSR